MKIGTTFDFKQAVDLGLDWRKVLEQIIAMHLSPVRIGVKWSEVETVEGEFGWEIYDEILDLLSEVEVILVVGIKVPRWPEYFIPDWIGREVVFGNNFQKKVFGYISKTLRRYADKKNIKVIQVENEPFLTSGPDQLSIPKTFLEEEIEFVKSTTNRPVLLTMQGLPTTGFFAEIFKKRLAYKKWLIKQSDIAGFNVFPKFEGKIFEKWNWVFKASFLAWKYLKYLKRFANTKGKRVLISELQAEPWQFGQVSHKDAFANKTCNPDLVWTYLRRLEGIGFGEVLMWGSEFWQKCEIEGAGEWRQIVD